MYLLRHIHSDPRMITRHDPRVEPSIILSGDQILGFSLRRPADINVVIVRCEGQGPEGEGIGDVEGVEGDDGCRKRKKKIHVSRIPQDIIHSFQKKKECTLSFRHGEQRDPRGTTLRMWT